MAEFLELCGPRYVGRTSLRIFGVNAGQSFTNDQFQLVFRQDYSWETRFTTLILGAAGRVRPKNAGWNLDSWFRDQA
jgi:hypothetical protein